MTTEIAVEARDVFVNGRRTYEGRIHDGRRIEGLLLDTRMVQALFDDAEPATSRLWAYPDTGFGPAAQLR